MTCIIFQQYRFFLVFQNDCAQEYNNGVFLALDEGYYRITVSLRSMNDPETYPHLHADILKDSTEVLAFCDTDDWHTTSMYTIVYKDKYRMFQVRIKDGTLNGTGEPNQNLIQIEMLS